MNYDEIFDEYEVKSMKKRPERVLDVFEYMSNPERAISDYLQDFEEMLEKNNERIDDQ
jgi:hypothetical protein